MSRASGWQTMLLSSPAANLTAGTTYAVSYSTRPSGIYAVSVNGLSTWVRTTRRCTWPIGGGAVPVRLRSARPTAVNHNYWVDVIFTPNG